MTSHAESDSKGSMNKIADQYLRRHAESEEELRVPVIVEVQAPDPTVEVGPEERSRGPSWRPQAVTWSKADEAGVAKTMEAAHKFLSRLLGVEPVALSAARAFGAEVNGRELREIALSDLTKAIYRDRKLD